MKPVPQRSRTSGSVAERSCLMKQISDIKIMEQTLNSLLLIIHLNVWNNFPLMEETLEKSDSIRHLRRYLSEKTSFQKQTLRI